MTDYEINKNAHVDPIKDILKKYNVINAITYGDNIAKIDFKNNNKNGKLILVTSTNPTPYGEGKTTLSIGLCDALNNAGYLTSVALREPSLGPVFGLKGGATGGGLCQVYPMDKINLHFTGDFHAITSANNLIAAVIDDHIYHGNKLNIKTILFKRCIDINDRSLRNICINDKLYHFNITAASELMSIFCLAKDFSDLRLRIDNIIVGTNSKDELIYVKQLGCTGSILALLKDAFIPNAVSTLNNNLAIIHGGPFANIAHGSNSVIATKTALQLSDYVITEAGFGSDCGALKFLDIKCRQNDLYPDLIVINSTIRSLKYHGNGDLKKGILNLKYHILNMQKFSSNVIVILNRFKDDLITDIEYVKNFCCQLNVEFSVSNMYCEGLKNTSSLVSKVVELVSRPNLKKYHIYELEDDIFTKITKYCKMFNASSVVYENNTYEKLKKIGKQFPNFQICISKTPNSITDDKSIIGYPQDFKMTVTDVYVNAGAKFITILMGNVLTLPGLSKDANYHNIDVIGDDIVGII